VTTEGWRMAVRDGVSANGLQPMDRLCTAHRRLIAWAIENRLRSIYPITLGQMHGSPTHGATCREIFRCLLGLCGLTYERFMIAAGA
jgi:hypothetical protein